MSDSLVAPTPDLLEFVLSDGSGGFTPFSRALDGLAGEDAVRKPADSPHSAAEVLAHMVFWQQRFLRMVESGEREPVQHASDGWPSVTAQDWPGLVDQYLSGLRRYRALASDTEILMRPVLPDSDRSVGASALSYHVHDAHDLGQIILIRRMLGAWPPPGGGDTW